MINGSSRAVGGKSGNKWAELVHLHVLERKIAEIESGGPRLAVTMLALSRLISRIEIAGINNSPVVASGLNEKVFASRLHVLEWREIDLSLLQAPLDAHPKRVFVLSFGSCRLRGPVGAKDKNIHGRSLEKHASNNSEPKRISKSKVDVGTKPRRYRNND
jgi:hypothetical protein